MKLGYIHNNREEQTRVMQVLKMTSESVALDELGIGRIRDAFADRMFPGISTLQKHMKYFSLMPQLYRKATEKRYNRLSEVKAEIIRLERIMTKNLYDGSADKRGITGSEMIGKSGNNYVKYDPAYMFCSFPNVDYDFTQKCTLDLTVEDKDFIVDHILNAEACQGTLLRYIVDNPDFAIADSFEQIPFRHLPQEIGELQDLARRFADFIYMVHIRYNYIYSQYQDEEMRIEFQEKLEEYRNSGTNIDKVLNAVSIRENSGKWFCKEVAERIAANDIEEDGGLDQLIINRERRVKGNRRKIGNPAYIYNKRNRIHYYKLTYRWETVKTFTEELRKEAING